MRLQKLEREKKQHKAKQLQLKIALSFQGKRRQDLSDIDDVGSTSLSMSSSSLGQNKIGTKVQNGAKTSVLELRSELKHAHDACTRLH